MQKNKRIKVLHCIESIGSGGVEQRRLSLSKHLDKNQFEQALVCAKVKGEFDDKLKSAGTLVFPLGPMRHPFNFSYYKKLFEVIKKFKPDIIHGAVFEGVISAVVGGLWFKVPIIIVEETSEPKNRSWRGNLLMRFLCHFANAVVATSPAVKNYLTQKLKLPAKKVTLILNGAEDFDNSAMTNTVQLRSVYKIEEDDFVVGFVGRLFNDVKQVTVLIDAISKLTKNDGFQKIKLLIVGDGPDRGMLEALVKTRELTENVIFAGYQAAPIAYYRMMNVFAIISAHEGFGMAAVEAMFFGLPVIGTSVGGINEIVAEGVTGMLVAVKDVTATAKAIETLFLNPDLRKKMGEAGRVRAQEKFTATRYAKEVEALYHHQLEKR